LEGESLVLGGKILLTALTPTQTRLNKVLFIALIKFSFFPIFIGTHKFNSASGCHGSDTRAQDGGLNPVNKPEALRDLLRHWKTIPK
jgi:hypothetical protein